MSCVSKRSSSLDQYPGIEYSYSRESPFSSKGKDFLLTKAKVTSPINKQRQSFRKNKDLPLVGKSHDFAAKRNTATNRRRQRPLNSSNRDLEEDSVDFGQLSNAAS